MSHKAKTSKTSHACSFASKAEQRVFGRMQREPAVFMGSLPSYAYASVPLILLSLWHAICSCRSYARSPSLFHARTWHPLPGLRYGEILLELLALAGAIAYQAVEALRLQYGSRSQILGVQQLVMLIFFMAVLLIIFISESTMTTPSLPSDANFLLLGAAFAVECFVAVCSASDPQLALELESFRILGAQAAFSAFVCFVLAWRPSSFLASIAYSASVALQGSWLLQLGLCLYTDKFIPDGCHRLSNGTTQCDVDVMKLRAIAIMDLLLVIHVVVIILVFACICSLAGKGSGGYRRNSGYEAVDFNGESDHLQMKPLSTKVVID